MKISKKFFSKIKKMKHTFLSSNVLRLVRQIFELKHSRFQPFYLQRTRKLHRLPFFSHSCASSSFKDAAPKVLWEKVISRRSKELKSDPGSCPLVLGAILKIWVTSSYIQFWLWPGLVTKIQTKKLSILPRFYFHDVLGQLKSNFHANFRFKRVLGFVTEHA